MNARRQKVIVIGGTGDAGRRRILPALADLGYARVDVVDPSPFPDSLPGNVERRYESVDEVDVAARGEVEAVIVASPNHLHYAHCCWAVHRAGVPCLTEKPLAATGADADKIVELSLGRVPVRVANHYLFKGASRFVHGRLAEILSRIGPLERVRGRILEPTETLVGRSWLLDPLRSGGGVWLDTGVHLVTLLMILMGPAEWEIEMASARGFDEHRGRSETHMSVSAHAGRTLIQLEVGKDSELTCKDMLLQGARGSVFMDWHNDRVSIDERVAWSGTGDVLEDHRVMLSAFFSGLQEGRGAGLDYLDCHLAREGQRRVKEVYRHSDLPPRIRSACVN